MTTPYLSGACEQIVKLRNRELASAEAMERNGDTLRGELDRVMAAAQECRDLAAEYDSVLRLLGMPEPGSAT